MQATSQVIWRNLDRLGHARDILLIRPPIDDLPVRLSRAGHTIEVLSHSFGAHSHFLSLGIDSHFGLTSPNDDRKYPIIILFQPREKALLEWLIVMATDVLEPDGELWLVGENKSGIKSAGRRLAASFAQCNKLDNARHCVLFKATLPLREKTFTLDDFVITWSFELIGNTFEVRSLPGVFAHGRLDHGTRLLMDTLTDEPLVEALEGRILDFGCGAGVIGTAIGRLKPAIDLTLLDDSALAIESSRLTLAGNQVQARLVASDGLDSLISAQTDRFDWIISNPPFHTGVRQDLQTAEKFLRSCPRLLAANGRLCIVANNHLPYRHWLEELFGEVQVIASDREYNVWLARNKNAA